MMLFSKDFWDMAFERMVKTIAQTAVASMTVTSFIPTDVDAWQTVLVTSGMAGLISVLTSLTSYDAVQKVITAPIADDVKLAVEIGQRQGPTIADVKANS